MTQFQCWMCKDQIKGQATEYVRVLIPALTMEMDKEGKGTKVSVRGKPYYGDAEPMRRHFLTCGADQPVPKSWLLQPVEGR